MVENKKYQADIEYEYVSDELPEKQRKIEVDS